MVSGVITIVVHLRDKENGGGGVWALAHVCPDVLVVAIIPEYESSLKREVNE